MSKLLPREQLEARLQKIIINNLDYLFHPITNESLYLASQVIEELTKSYISIFLCSNIERISAYTRKAKGNQKYFYFKGNRYSLSIVDDVWYPSRLNVALIHMTGNPRGRRPKALKTHLDIYSRYSEIDFFFPDGISLNTNLICFFINRAFEISSKWLEENISAFLSTEENFLSLKMYGALRTMINDEDICNSIWFVTIIDGRGYYLIDPRKSIHTISSIKASQLTEGMSPSFYMMELLNSKLQYETMNSKNAIDTENCINANIYDSKFADEKPDYVNAVAAMVNSANHSIYPVVSEGKYFLLAGFPSKYRGNLESKFEANQEYFEQIFRDYYSRVKHIKDIFKDFSRVRSDNSILTKVEKILGGLIVKTEVLKTPRALDMGMKNEKELHSL